VLNSASLTPAMSVPKILFGSPDPDVDGPDLWYVVISGTAGEEEGTEEADEEEEDVFELFKLRDARRVVVGVMVVSFESPFKVIKKN
jgi:hypothetical protein